MTEEDTKKERKEIYAETRRDLLARQLSNSQYFDQAILGLASGVLALSISFVKDVVPLQRAEHLWLLISAWVLLGGAILCTVVSFIVGQLGIAVQLDFAKKYYLEEQEDYLTKRNPYTGPTNGLNYGAGGLFVVGIVMLVVFTALNVTKEARMSDQKLLQEAAPIPALQQIERHAAPIPTMQAITPSGPSSSTGTVPSQPTNLGTAAPAPSPPTPAPAPKKE